eukprot:TRINITY_DN6977_c0_g1_i2.p2 TRINITY_DN6977_c0_g1~~TRINITY_DN6977_c0_g1_i2.p2  ORF type:complete len:357 (+),score=125.06 TRINITY_DN6977_c0_g1_i2:128-1198(+)
MRAHMRSCQRWLQLAAAAVVLLAAAGCARGAELELRREYLTGPYTFAAGEGAQKDYLPVERPTGSPSGAYVITSWSLRVLNSTLHEVELLEGQEADGRAMYFHHAVLHEWDESRVSVVHSAQMLFLASPDMVGGAGGLRFAPGAGIRFTDEDPQWALCCHAVNRGSSELSFFLQWEITYRPQQPRDRVLSLQFFGRQLGPRPLPVARDGASVLKLAGAVLSGHGAATVHHVQWHLHRGVSRAVLAVRRDGLQRTLAETTFRRRPGATANGIEVHEVVAPPPALARVLPSDELLLTAAVDPEVQEADVEAGDKLMVYALLHVSYEDGFRQDGRMLYLAGSGAALTGHAYPGEADAAP